MEMVQLQQIITEVNNKCHRKQFKTANQQLCIFKEIIYLEIIIHQMLNNIKNGFFFYFKIINLNSKIDHFLYKKINLKDVKFVLSNFDKS